uniref:GED domain-containing protein n=1 Tax=Panagrolaimus superbus TaxID=310955 RepID=A0A914YSL3_9BILA
MNPGTNAMNELMGQTIPVRLGIIGVINRSQEEIAQNIDIETCLTKEQTFFRENYPSIASRNGFQYLRQRLNQLLIQHIAQNLPSLRDGINNMVIEHEAILEDLGEPVEEDQSKLAIEVIRKFAKLFENLIDGWNELDTTQLAGGARIGREFRNFSSFNSIAADGGLTEMVVITAMRNAHGTRVGLLAPGNALEQLTKRQTSRLREPSIKFVDVIKAILLEIIDYCTIKIKEEERNRFPLLYSRMNKIACGIVNARFQPTKEFVEKIVDMQLNYNNFKHPTFNEELDDETKQNIANCIISAPQRTNPFSDDENENDEIASSGASEGYGTQRNSPLQQNSLQDKILIDEVRDSIKLRYYIKQYYNIVRISLQDLLPKAIMTELVNHVKESMQRLLEEKIFALEDVQKLTKESEAITNRREETKEKLEDLEHAKELLQGIVEQNI